MAVKHKIQVKDQKVCSFVVRKNLLLSFFKLFYYSLKSEFYFYIYVISLQE